MIGSMARYRAIAADLAAKIRDGHYGPGDALPAQRELSAAYGVTLMTLRQALQELGAEGLIVPDLPLDELAGLSVPGIDVSLLASPATPDDRLAEIGRRSQGFVYAVSVMGTTGERDRLAPSAAALAARVKQVTDLPVLLGFGISTRAQAAEAAAVADGVVVGAAVMRRVLDGDGPAEVGAFVASLRAALSGPIAVR